MDPIERLGDEQLRELAADVQVQLEKGTGVRPVLYFIRQARKKAAKAIVLFMDADPADEKLMRRLQQELMVYNDMVMAARSLLIAGREANQRISEGERSEIEEVIAGMTDDERQLHGFERRGID